MTICRHELWQLPLIFSIEFIGREMRKASKSVFNKWTFISILSRYVTITSTSKWDNSFSQFLESILSFFKNFKFFHSSTFFIYSNSLINFTLIGRPPVYNSRWLTWILQWRWLLLLLLAANGPFNRAELH